MSYTTLISAEALKERIYDPAWVVLDCRFSLQDPAKGRLDYQAAHLPGARYVHLDEDLSAPIVPGKTGRHPLPDIDALATTLGRLGITSTSQVVAYDDMGGPFAARLWWLLRWLGHEAVAVLDGGWQAWTRNGYEVTTANPEVAAAEYVPTPRPEMIVTTEDILSRLHAPGMVLVDARASERYAGIHEPIDPVAGHIPGAVSFPFKDNLDGTGAFASPADLRNRFAPLADRQDDLIVCYCGSGVTAAHNVLAMTHAGLNDIRMYPGSWSEWILDSNRPVGTLPQ